MRRLRTLLFLVVFLGWVIGVNAGSLVYVSNEQSHTISVIDSGTDTIIATISDPLNRINFPFGMVTNLAGTRLYVANSKAVNNTVVVIDTITRAVVAVITVGNAPSQMDITPVVTKFMSPTSFPITYQ